MIIKLQSLPGPDISRPASPLSLIWEPTELASYLQLSHWLRLAETGGVKVYFKQTFILCSLAIQILGYTRLEDLIIYYLIGWGLCYTWLSSHLQGGHTSHHTLPLSESANKSRCIIVEGFMVARERKFPLQSEEKSKKTLNWAEGNN